MTIPVIQNDGNKYVMALQIPVHIVRYSFLDRHSGEDKDGWVNWELSMDRPPIKY